MANAPRVPKTLLRKLRDLDDHLFLLRHNLAGLKEDLAHVKALSAELRTLVCKSSGTEGLLWRLTEELGVSDEVAVAGAIDLDPALVPKSHVLVNLPLYRPPFEGFDKPPARHSLRRIIKSTSATFIRGKGLTHEYLIKAISQQIGSAHEDEGVEPALLDLGNVIFNGAELYVDILALDGELTVEVGERVIEHAESQLGYRRRPQGKGDLTVAVRLGPRVPLTEPRTALLYRSWVNSIDVRLICTPDARIFAVRKREKVLRQYAIPLVELPATETDELFAWSYSSQARQARAFSSASVFTPSVSCDLGWVDFQWLLGPIIGGDHTEFANVKCHYEMSGLLSYADSLKLMHSPVGESPTDDPETIDADQASSPFPD